MSWFRRLLGTRSQPCRSHQRSSVRFRLEELEPRWVPSAVQNTPIIHGTDIVHGNSSAHGSNTSHTIDSTNWSGYAVNSTAGSVTFVRGNWTVPTVTGTGTKYSAVWVGIDGYSSPSVEQTGTEEDVVNGVAQYSAWYEMYPNLPVTLNMAIHPGDQMSASVTYSTTTGKFTLSIQDLSDTSNNSFSISLSAPNAQRSSAEWIVEAPSSNTGVLPLANFGSVTFSNASATINSVTGPINNSTWANRVQAINMITQGGTLLDTTSALNATGNGFTVTYSLPSTPPPPPTTGSVTTTTTLTATVNNNFYFPYAILTAVVSPSVPVGSEVELLNGSTVLATGRVRDVGGVDEVSFAVFFFETGSFTFTAEYLGTGNYLPSTSNSVTIDVT